MSRKMGKKPNDKYVQQTLSWANAKTKRKQSDVSEEDTDQQAVPPNLSSDEPVAPRSRRPRLLPPTIQGDSDGEEDEHMDGDRRGHRRPRPRRGPFVDGDKDDDDEMQVSPDKADIVKPVNREDYLSQAARGFDAGLLNRDYGMKTAALSSMQTSNEMALSADETRRDGRGLAISRDDGMPNAAASSSTSRHLRNRPEKPPVRQQREEAHDEEMDEMERDPDPKTRRCDLVHRVQALGVIFPKAKTVEKRPWASTMVEGILALKALAEIMQNSSLEEVAEPPADGFDLAEDGPAAAWRLAVEAIKPFCDTFPDTAREVGVIQTIAGVDEIIARATNPFATHNARQLFIK